MTVTITLERFQGPLDLLLELIHNQELEVNDVSLKEVTDQFIQYVEREKIPVEELSDFLTVAVKLVLIKTRSLLPYLEVAEEDEGDLEKQLKIYEVYWKAAKRISAMALSTAHLFGKPKNPQLLNAVFSPPKKKKILPNDLASSFRDVIARIEPIRELPKSYIKQAVSLAKKITLLRTLLEKKGRISFRSFISNDNDSRTDVIVNFLAALELIKQNEIDTEHRINDVVLIRLS